MNTVEERIETWEKSYLEIKDRTTLAYLTLLNAMRSDYEQSKQYDKCKMVCEEIEKFCVDTKLTDDSISNILLASYDSRARLGDIRAYCIALEWNRPIDKQFFLPRKRILEKPIP